MAEIRVDVTSHAQEFIERKDELIGIALEIIGTKMADYAAMNLERNPRRVDTGRLKNSLTHQVDGNVVCVGTNVEYAPYVEYGTSKMEANHFLKNAVSGHADEYKRIFEEYSK